MPNDPHILTAAISALLGVPVITHEEHHRNPVANYMQLDMDAFHKSVLVAPTPGCPQPGPYPGPQPGQQTGPINVFVKTLDGTSVAITVNLNDSVETLKARIAYKVDLPPKKQRLVFAGKQLEDGLILRDSGIQAHSTIHLPDGGPAGLHLPKDFLDPGYDYDFTHIDDHGKSFSRGGKVYKRPTGWLRYALKVEGKFGYDTWLGDDNKPGVWPVSYHGTGKSNAGSIAETGYQLSKGKRFLYGQGIYSTPHHETAELYAIEYTVKGKRYKVILQNRVNPSNLKEVDNTDYWINPGDHDLRPYAICIKHY